AASAVMAEAAPLPDFGAVRAGYRASDVLVLDRGGSVLQRVRADFEGRRGYWLALEEVSAALVAAVIQSEDRRFYAHNGVDFQALLAAGWNSLQGAGVRGASTLTMQ